MLAELCWAYRAGLCDLGERVAEIVERFYPAATFGTLIADLPRMHARPKGSILLVETGQTVVGCGMLHPLNAADAEMKRVFIDTSVQGRGAGKTLSQALITQARVDGYRRILLDTTRLSTAARGLYAHMGFEERGPYAEIPADVLDTLVFYELKL